MAVNWTIAVGIGLLILGILFSSAGYRVLRLVLGIVGFGCGAALAALVLAGSNQPQHVIALAAILGGAIVGALLAYPLYLAGLFLQGAGLAVLPLMALGITEPPFLPLLAAVCGGTLTVVFQRPIIIVTTSLEGAFCIVYGLQSLFGSTPPLTTLEAYSIYAAPGAFPPPLFAGIVIAVFVLGCVAQFRSVRRDDLHDSLRERSKNKFVEKSSS